MDTGGADWRQLQEQDEEQQFLLQQMESERVIYPALYAQAEREMGIATKQSQATARTS
jgi:hypothetical protein